MVRNQYPDIAGTEMPNDPLDIEHRNGIDARKRLVEQHELRLGGKRTCDFHTPPLAAREALSDLLRMWPICSSSSSDSSSCRVASRDQFAARFQNRQDVVLDGELAKHRGFLRQIAQARAGRGDAPASSEMS